MSRYKKTGILGDPATIGKRKAIFADCTELTDFHSLQIKIANAKQGFMQLPSDLRARFDNEPYKLVSFLQDESNYDEAVKLGLIQPKTDPGNPGAEPTAPEEPPAPSE